MADAKAKPEKPPKSKTTGRPSSYTEERGLAICNLVSVGKSIRKICAMPGMPNPDTIYYWIATIPAFSELYARAKEQMVIVLGEELLEIVDDESGDKIEVGEGDSVRVVANHAKVQRDKLRVETRKFLMGKLMPHKYGEPKQRKDGQDEDGSGKLVVEIKGGLPSE